MSAEKQPMEASAMKAQMEAAGVPEEHLPLVQAGVAAGFDFAKLLRVIMLALGNPDLIAALKDLFGM